MFRTVLLLLVATGLQAGQLRWQLTDLKKPPQYWEASSPEPDVQAVWIAGPLYKGNPTRAFAYYGLPEGKSPVPAMVLIHGGGGTAFAEWVRMWNREGFAAIAVDTVGTIPEKATESPWNPSRKRHEFAGPPGWGDFANVDSPVTDQWTYHAVAVSIAAHSFLRMQPGVDPKRVGVTGISWGGYLTSIVASLDDRFRFGIPVYGCGFLSEDSAWLKEFEKLGPDRTRTWVRLWDPSSYLSLGRNPMFWINGTNDFAYVMPSWQKSYRLPRGERLLSLQVRMKHSHPDGAKPPEIFAYARSKLLDGPALVVIRKQGTSKEQAWATYNRGTPVKAELYYTNDTAKWQERKWESLPAVIDFNRRRVAAAIPKTAHVYYLNLIDNQGLIVSTAKRSTPPSARASACSRNVSKYSSSVVSPRGSYSAGSRLVGPTDPAT
jgi:dienelactone hydrolase